MIENSALIGSIILMFFGAIMIGRRWVMEGIPAQITAIMLNISKNRYMILLMCNVVDHHLLASTVHAATRAGPRVKGFDAALRQWGFKNRGENRALEVKR